MTERNLDGLLKTIEANPGAVVVMDSLRSVTRSTGIDENSPEIGPLLYDLKTAVTDAGGTLMLVHHCNKSNDTIGTEALSGHNSIPSAGNTVITLHYLGDNKETLNRRMVREARSGQGADLVVTGGGDSVYSSKGCYSDFEKDQIADQALGQLHNLFNTNKDLENALCALLKVFRNSNSGPGISLIQLMQQLDLVRQDVAKVGDLNSLEMNSYRNLKNWLDKNCEQPGKFIKRRGSSSDKALVVSVKLKSSAEGRGAQMYALSEYGASTLGEIFKQRG